MTACLALAAIALVVSLLEAVALALVCRHWERRFAGLSSSVAGQTAPPVPVAVPAVASVTPVEAFPGAEVTFTQSPYPVLGPVAMPVPAPSVPTRVQLTPEQQKAREEWEAGERERVRLWKEEGVRTE